MLKGGYFHLIRICSIFLQISQKWCEMCFFQWTTMLVTIQKTYFGNMQNKKTSEQFTVVHVYTYIDIPYSSNFVHFSQI